MDIGVGVAGLRLGRWGAGLRMGCDLAGLKALDGVGWVSHAEVVSGFVSVRLFGRSCGIFVVFDWAGSLALPAFDVSRVLMPVYGGLWIGGGFPSGCGVRSTIS
ncbi:MAG: hypothetical protein LC114_21130 [Bryobacterales bacterium]|nr:hypothetical protein [Bryobacterales bacterium]